MRHSVQKRIRTAICRIVFINVALVKKNHSIVDKKKSLHVLQVLSYELWDKNACSNTYEHVDKMAPFLASEMA